MQTLASRSSCPFCRKADQVRLHSFIAHILNMTFPVIVKVVNLNFDNLLNNFVMKLTEAGRDKIRNQDPNKPLTVLLNFTNDFPTNDPDLIKMAKAIEKYVQTRDDSQDQGQYVKLNYVVYEFENTDKVLVARVRGFMDYCNMCMFRLGTDKESKEYSEVEGVLRAFYLHSIDGPAQPDIVYPYVDDVSRARASRARVLAQQ